MVAFIVAFVCMLAFGRAEAAPCANPDFEKSVTGDKECLVIRTFRSPSKEGAPVLVAVLHGDVSSGGPASYHIRKAGEIAADRGIGNVVAVAIVRPGYPDGDGGESSGNHYGRSDHYTAENVGEVAAAIARLKAHHKADRVVLLGHSGGAATAAVILGMKPDLANAAVLVACPCDIDAWRSQANRRPWPRSESPHKWADKVASGTKVLAITGSGDGNTTIWLAETYVALLAKGGIAARFLAVSGDHNGSFNAPEVQDAVVRLVKEVRANP